MRGALQSLRCRARGDDRGSILTELLVALVVFSVVAAALAGLMISMIKKTASTRYDSTAAQLLTKDLDVARAMGASALTETSSPVLVGTEVLGGQTYETYRMVEKYGPSQVCGVTAATSKKVTTTIKWTEILAGTKKDASNNTIARESKSIVGQTVMTPLPGTLTADTKGSYGVTVKDQAGKGIKGIKVNFTKGAAGTTPTAGNQLLTDEDGCALLQNLTPGESWTAWLGDQPTYVPAGYRLTSDPAYTFKTNSIVANESAHADFKYALAAKLTLGVDTDSTHPVPANIPFTIANSDFPTVPPTYWSTYTASTATAGPMFLPGSLPATTMGPGNVFTALFPSTNGYEPWLGSCTDNDPGSGTGKRGAAVVLSPGSVTGTGTAKVIKYDLTLTKLTVATDLKISVKHDDTTAPCANAPGQNYVIAPSNVLTSTKPTGTTQVVKFALPYGAWIITVANQKSKTVAVNWGSGAATSQSSTLDMS